MRCRNCEYPLWGLAARVCPECGTAFRPGEFDFAVNQVQFCCPNCRQVYYGTDARGHLVPVEFECVQCGQRVHMDEMVLLPVAGEGELPATERMPWLDRRRRGAVRAWLATVGMGLVRPTRLIKLTPAHDTTLGAVWFAVLSNLLFVLSGTVVIVAVMGYFIRQSGMPVAQIGGFVIGIAAAMAIFGAGLWALSAHVVLLITGGSAHRFPRTLQAFCYSSAANCFLAVPCLFVWTWPVAFIWWAVSCVFMVREGQKVHGMRAALAVLALPLLMIGVLFAGRASARSTRSATIVTATTSGPAVTAGFNPTLFDPAAQESEARVVLKALQSFAAAHGQALPDHAVQLLMDGRLNTGQLVSEQSSLTGGDIRIGRLSLSEVELLSSAQQRVLLKDLLAQLPPGTVAHRLGDFVFTHHGIRLPAVDPELWLVVVAPRAIRADEWGPVAEATAPPGVTVGRAGGDTVYIPGDRLPQELARQNALRAAAGLTPLPDLLSVSASQPAVAP